MFIIKGEHSHFSSQVEITSHQAQILHENIRSEDLVEWAQGLRHANKSTKKIFLVLPEPNFELGASI